MEDCPMLYSEIRGLRISKMCGCVYYWCLRYLTLGKLMNDSSLCQRYKHRDQSARSLSRILGLLCCCQLSLAFFGCQTLLFGLMLIKTLLTDKKGDPCFRVT